MNVWELCSPPFVQIDRAVGSKNEPVRPYSHFETLVEGLLVGNQEQ